MCTAPKENIHASKEDGNFIKCCINTLPFPAGNIEGREMHSAENRNNINEKVPDRGLHLSYFSRKY